MATLKELRDKVVEIRTNAEAILAQAETEKRDLTTEEETRFNQLSEDLEAAKQAVTDKETFLENQAKLQRAKDRANREGEGTKIAKRYSIARAIR